MGESAIQGEFWEIDHLNNLGLLENIENELTDV